MRRAMRRDGSPRKILFSGPPMVRTASKFALVFAVAAACFPTPSSRRADTVRDPSSSRCYTPSQFSNWAITDFRWSDTTSDSATVSRMERWNLPRVAAREIALQENSSKCGQALSAYNTALLPDSNFSSRIYLFAYGSRHYIAVDTTRRAGEWLMHVVLDSSLSVPLHIFRR
jgi:hypothetical protein